MQAITHATTMDKLKWIQSEGGPLVLISDNSYNFWSGTLKRSLYLDDKIEEADDFLNADEADYGKACLIQDYLGVVKIGDDIALVLGDEPLLTTVFNSVDGKPIIARWHYRESKDSVEGTLRTIDLNSINNWESPLTFKVSSNRQFLFDAAYYGNALDEEGNDYLPINIKQGDYKIWTSIYEPDDKTRLLIHKFESTN